jgi:serine/threonine-protein kinase PknK
MELIVDEDGRRRVVRLNKAPVRIGRASDNEVRLSDVRVSRHHCAFEPGEDGGWIVDLGSSNGLVVNGRRTRRAFLAPGDELVLGAATIRLQHVAQPGPDADLALQTLAGESLDHTERLRGFARIAGALVREVDLDKLLRLIVDSAIELVEAERGFLLLENTPASAGELGVRVARSFDASDIPLPSSRLSHGIARRVLDSGEPVLSVDAGRDDRFDGMRSVDDLRLRSVLCVPIRDGLRVVGALYVDNRLQQGVFAQGELELVALFADQAALAIRNARLVEELTARNRRLAESCAQIEALNERLGRKVRDRDEQLAVARAELGRERGKYDYTGIVGASDAMRRLFVELERVVECDLPVLIHGESGTGKELVARAIHTNGERRSGPFISENCAALPDTLLESELFGHARGAFTGADRAKKGLIEQAHGGTLFLDEIGDMSAEMQKKLLRVLEEGELRPLGSDRRVEVDVRLVAASHRDLRAMVDAGDFREDLFYRVAVLTLELPPLRERHDDVPLLARELLARAAREMRRELPVLTHEVLAALAAYPWPGNVRELDNELRRALIAADEAIRLEHLSPQVREGGGAPSEVAPPAVAGDLRGAVAAFECGAIEAALERHQGNKSRAAAELGISRFALQRKLDKYGLASDDSSVG